MGIRITKYENSPDIKFDESAFDYTYDSDTFPADAETDFEDIIDEAGGSFSVIQSTDTTDGSGNVTGVSETSFNITAYIMDISKKDLKIRDLGLAVPGNRTLYVKDVYGSDVVKEGNIFVDRNGYHWRIVTVLDEPFINNNEIYKKAVIKSIGLEGSG